MLLVGTRRRDAMRIDNLFSRFPQGMGGERADSWVRGGRDMSMSNSAVVALLAQCTKDGAAQS